ncbi:MAG: hypothetical protein IIB56_05170 [Planctomycetes bacterium]|nr:hypothetical protein [Planctomycetota bacterium]MCH8118976.1 hypothetical protein [Planctomycetota bacterium]
MDYVTILAQAVETASAQAAEEAVVPIESFWAYITSLNLVEAITFMSFGVVCLFYGWRVFKILVVICFALLGMFLGLAITDKIVGLNSQLWGGLIGMGLLAILSVPLMRWAVSALGAVAGGILSSGIWYACGLTERYIWAGALIGMVAGGMISFIIFKVAVILFSSLGGSGLIVVGALALLYLYPQTSERVEEIIFTKKWFLPTVLMAPTLIGIVLQNKFVKDSKDWDM